MTPRRSSLADPRVETLVAWANERELALDERGWAAIAALEGAPPGADTAAALALAVAAAYARVPRVGPRDLRAGHALVSLLGRLGEPGARELVRLRERVRYHHPLRAIQRTLHHIEREGGTPLGELDDAFAGLELDSHLTAAMPVGPYEALIQVADDLRRVRTLWLKRLRQSLARPPVARARLP